MTALNTMRRHYSHQAAITRTRNTWNLAREERSRLAAVWRLVDRKVEPSRTNVVTH